jgi:Schlafen, AlbA_2
MALIPVCPVCLTDWNRRPIGDDGEPLNVGSADFLEVDFDQLRLRMLKGDRLAFLDNGSYPRAVRPTYAGLVWEFRRDLVSGARFIDGLIEEWETTSVEFKRELILETADQKAKFIKEVISLANTQASGRRWLIAGFDDDTQGFYGPVPAKLTQDRIQGIVSQYIRPDLEVRYKTINYKQRGHVGLLEILRRGERLPYTAVQSLGEKKAGNKFSGRDRSLLGMALS